MHLRELVSFIFLLLMMSFCNPGFSESSSSTKSEIRLSMQSSLQTSPQSSTQDSSTSSTSSNSRTASESVTNSNASNSSHPRHPKVQMTITLEGIEAKKLSRKSGDKIYLNITQYSNLEHAHTTRMPEKPSYWISKQLPQVKNLILWNGTIQENEEIKLIFSLVEEDFSYWDIDDFIGAAQVVISNKNGKIETRWELPIFEERTEMLPTIPLKKGNKNGVIKESSLQKEGKKEIVRENSPQFIMKGQHSQYELWFSLAENPSPPL